MQAVPPSPFVLRPIVLATLGLLPLGLMAASAQTSRAAPPAPADANRPASPPASLDMLKERDEELEKLRAEQTPDSRERSQAQARDRVDRRRPAQVQSADHRDRRPRRRRGGARSAQTAGAPRCRSTTRSRRCGPRCRNGAALIAEVLAALQRIGRQTAAGAHDPGRGRAAVGALGHDAGGGVARDAPAGRGAGRPISPSWCACASRSPTSASRLARDLLVLADERQRLSLFIDERQKRQAEAGTDARRGAPAAPPPWRSRPRISINLSSSSSRVSTARRVGARRRRARATTSKGRDARPDLAALKGSRAAQPRPLPSLQPRECCRFRSMARESREFGAPDGRRRHRKGRIHRRPARAAKSRPRATDGWFMPDPSAIMANS